MGELTRIDISKGWMPDFLPYEMPEGGCVECKNLLPYTEFFAAAYGSQAIATTTLSGTPLAGEMFKDTSLIRKTYIGTTTKLYECYGSTITDKSPTAGISTATTLWDFAQYGNWIIATNNIDAPIVLKTFSAANFETLANAPTTAKHVHFNNGHLVFGYTADDPKKLEWSAWQDVEDYTASLTTGAGSSVISDADGEITGIVAIGQHMAVFHPESISFVHYTGFPYTFNIIPRKVRNVGGIQKTMISVGGVCYFWDNRDIYMFDGNQEQAIGTGVRREVLDRLDLSNTHRISAAFDPYRRLIYWAYPTVASVDGSPDKVLLYNIEARKFSWLDIDVQCLFRMITGAITMDNIDTIYTDIDQMPYHMDSSRYNGSLDIMGGCVSGQICTFDGAVLSGEIITKEMSSGEDVLHINRVRPNIQAYTPASVAAYVGSRMSKSDVSISYTDASTINTSDNCDLRKSGRLLRVKITTGSHSGLASIEADLKKVSGR